MIEGPRHIAVIDIGKTNAKLAVVDRIAMVEPAVLTRPNHVLPGPPYPHFDTDGIWDFVLSDLRELQSSYGVGGIAVTTHGACAAFLARDGSLATPVLDYEYKGPDETAAAYNAIRPEFARTGSPRLGAGLNLGAQLHWLLARDPGLRDRVDRVVTWPQYWGHRLTGNAACDVCSLGCHTDLWEPASGRFSPLADRLGLADKMATPRQPGESLGAVLPNVAAATGLPPGTPVVCGIHDSNASLLPHLFAQTGPFAVVSTGTWVVCMAMAGSHPTLDAARDTLINVAADGQPVPSARFMGGRDYEMIRAGRSLVSTAADEALVLAAGLMLWPSVTAGGPFPGQAMRWSQPPSPFGDGAEGVALSFYLALMTAECLMLTGATGPVIVEGPFGANPAYCRMLAAACGRQVLGSLSETGTSLGAALLFGAPDNAPPLVETVQTTNAADYRQYARAWRAAVNA